MPEEIDRLARKWQRRAYQAWAIVGACVIAGIVLYVCGILWQAVATVVLTAFIVFVLHHFVSQLQRRGIPRAGGVVISYAIGAVVLLGVLVMLIPALTSQVTTFANSLPGYVQQTQDFAEEYLPRIAVLEKEGDPESWGDRLADWAQQASSLIGGQATEVLKGFAGGVVGAAVNVGNGLLVLFISLICAAWVLIDLPTLARELHGLVSARTSRRLDIVSEAFGIAIYGWMKSTLI